MRGVVVDDAVDVELAGHGVVNVAQEAQELLMSVPRLAAGDDFAAKHVERGEQGGRPMALVVVGDAFDVAKPHGQ